MARCWDASQAQDHQCGEQQQQLDHRLTVLRRHREDSSCCCGPTDSSFEVGFEMAESSQHDLELARDARHGRSDGPSAREVGSAENEYPGEPELPFERIDLDPFGADLPL